MFVFTSFVKFMNIFILLHTTKERIKCKKEKR